MKPSELVKLRNTLSSITLSDLKHQIDKLDGELSKIDNIPLHYAYKEVLDNFIGLINEIESNIETVEFKLPILIENIDQELSETTEYLLTRGYKIGDGYGSTNTDVKTEREDRVMEMHDETRAEIFLKIKKYTDWKFPTLEIGPGDGIWTEHLVAGDPLYIVDVHQEFLDSTLNKFNPVYRNRVRPYLIGAHGVSDTDLSMLPTNQFGFIFAWDVFDYFQLNYVEKFLKQCFNLLRPGGVMMFSYNNCEIEQCAMYAETGFKSWMPKTLLVNTCLNYGFEIIETANLEDTIHWIEIKKPGELKTVKAHQVLGKIINL